MNKIRTSKDTKHNARVAGIIFCISAIFLGILFVYDIMDGEIQVGGKGSASKILTVDSDKNAFILQTIWIGLLIGAVAVTGICLTIWGFSNSPVHKQKAVNHRRR